MNTTKKLLIIIAALLSGFALVASCSKEPEVNAVRTEKKKPLPVENNGVFPERKHSFDAVRNGQYASLNWSIDAPKGKIKRVCIMRSASGVGQKKRVADLKPGATSYDDKLPDKNAHWYWLEINIMDEKSHKVGPVRVPPDTSETSRYTDLKEKYKISITRTDEMATLKWNFPDGEYKVINIVRFPRLATEFKGSVKGVTVASTLECKSQYSDALPDANLDYWYWFRIIMQSGAISYLGPIKAEFGNQ